VAVRIQTPSKVQGLLHFDSDTVTITKEGYYGVHTSSKPLTLIIIEADMTVDVTEIEKRINDSYELPNSVVDVVPHPLVTVRTYTYQHGDFIRQCIEGVLMQKTTFPFEFIIGEDFSTDGTREIVFEYAQRYPNVIRVITADYNVGGMANVIRCRRRTRGKYIALCDGDDYWTDPLKLQKQVDFLESHPEYGLVHTDHDKLYVAENKIVHSVRKSFLNSHQTHYKDQKQLFDMIIEGSYPILTATTVFRASLYDTIQKQLNEILGQFLMGDTPAWLEMSRLTKFHYIDEVCAVHRILPESAAHSRSVVKQLRFTLSEAEMRVYFVKKYRTDMPMPLKRRYNKSLILYKTFVPNYIDRYPLIQPGVIERFFYNIHHPSTRFLVQLWFRLLSIKDYGIRFAICLLMKKVRLLAKSLVKSLLLIK
jgi:glycosyltransferase involved in cell wall biosynthesis